MLRARPADLLKPTSRSARRRGGKHLERHARVALAGPGKRPESAHSSTGTRSLGGLASTTGSLVAASPYSDQFGQKKPVIFQVPFSSTTEAATSNTSRSPNRAPTDGLLFVSKNARVSFS